MKRAWIAIAFGLSMFAAACATEQGAAGHMRAGRGLASDEAAGDDAPLSLLAASSRAHASDESLRRTKSKAGDPSTQAPEATARPDRMLIYRGDLRVEVARPEDSAREFLAKVKEWGGYMQSQVGTTIVVRLPAPKFDEAFAAARALGRVLDESRQANDVTEEFLDLGIRLDTAKKARERLLDVLKRAEKVEDILKVEAELRRLTEEIERMEGRQKFLADQVALATLTVTLTPIAEAPPPPRRERLRSRFDWINNTGPEALMRDR